MDGEITFTGFAGPRDQCGGAGAGELPGGGAAVRSQ